MFGRQIIDFHCLIGSKIQRILPYDGRLFVGHDIVTKYFPAENVSGCPFEILKQNYEDFFGSYIDSF